MTKEQIQEKYTALDTEQCKWWVNHLFSMAKEQACNSGNFEDGEEMQAAQDKIIKILEHDANLDNRAEQLKTELREILDSYSGIHFINTTEVDVDKFKEEMSVGKVSIYPSVNIKMINIGTLIQGLRGWVEENSLYYDDEKDPLDRTKKTIVNSPKAIPLSELNKLIAVANEKQS